MFVEFFEVVFLFFVGFCFELFNMEYGWYIVMVEDCC